MRTLLGGSEGSPTPLGTVFCIASPAQGKGRAMKRSLLSRQLVWVLMHVRPRKLDLTNSLLLMMFLIHITCMHQLVDLTSLPFPRMFAKLQCLKSMG